MPNVPRVTAGSHVPGIPVGSASLPDVVMVLACGVSVLDVQQTVDRLPEPDEKLVADELLVASGGPAANAAVTAVALGVGARSSRSTPRSAGPRLPTAARTQPTGRRGSRAAWMAARGTGGLQDGLAWAARIAADSCTAAGARGWLADEHRLARHRKSLAPDPPPGHPQVDRPR